MLDSLFDFINHDVVTQLGDQTPKGPYSISRWPRYINLSRVINTMGLLMDIKRFIVQRDFILIIGFLHYTDLNNYVI